MRSVVWLKRDLRLVDHRPLARAAEGQSIVIYIAEPSLRGAEDFVLYGYSMGGAITSAFLHESAEFSEGVTLTDRVSGVIFDSPVLDLEAVVDAGADDRGIPAIITAAAKGIAALRFDVDWDALDQVERAAEFDPNLPILLFHGTEDATVPVESSDAFAAALESVQYERIEGADHVYPWNVNPVGYERTVLDFLAGLQVPTDEAGP